MKFTLLLGTVMLFAILAAAACGGGSTKISDNGSANGDDLAKAVVFIEALDETMEPVWSGSGTLISGDGLILTNAHVATDMADDLPGIEHPTLIIAPTLRADEAPEGTYIAEVVAVDYVLDLAVVKVVSDLDGVPLEQDLPFLPFGDSDLIGIGENIRILGYPGIGGETITFTDGAVSGFTSERTVGSRAWIKTNATIASGNSGGLAADQAGRIVGVPTIGGSGSESAEVVDCDLVADTNRDGVVDENDTCVSTSGFINSLRPINLAKPLIDAARTADVYVSAYEQPDIEAAAGFSPVDVNFSEITFADGVTQDDEPSQIYEAYPSGRIEICAFWDFEGMTDGASWDAHWFIDGELNEDVSFFEDTWNAGETGNMWICAAGDSEMPDGLYELALSVEDEFMGSGTIFVGGDHPMVQLVVFNESAEDICYVFISPTGAQNWGFDRLGADEGIRVGDVGTFDLPKGSYDVLVEDCAENTLAEEYELDVTDGTPYTVTG